jgi:hypothetical protein
MPLKVGTKKLPRGGGGVNGRGPTSGRAISLHRRGFPGLSLFGRSSPQGPVRASFNDVFYSRQSRTFHKATDGWPYVMGMSPQFVEADMGPTRFFFPEQDSPRGASMGEGLSKPVESQEQGMGATVTKKDREVGRPSAQGRGPDLHSLVPEEG